MNITNPWLTPYQRSYHQIKQKLIEGLKSITDSNGRQLVTDVSEGNILVIVISMFAAIAEVLHYYIDTKAREFFLPTARRYTSLQALGNLVGYYPHGATAATTDLVVTRTTSLNTTANISQGATITQDGTTWAVSQPVKIAANVGLVRIPLIQHRSFDLSGLVPNILPAGTTQLTIASDSLPSGEFYEHGTMALTLGDIQWALVDTFAYSKPDDTHFRVEIDNNGNILIIFGDGTFGKVPISGSRVSSCTCYLTKGAAGNVDAGAITTLPSGISSSVWKGSNEYAAAGGTDYEDVESMRNRIPLQARTQGVAITKRDYEDLALMVPGVVKAKVDYQCGRKVALYILPSDNSANTNLVAANTLKQKVWDKLNPYLPLTTILKVFSLGTSNIVLNIDVTGRANYKKEDILAHIRTALYNAYNIQVSEIGGSVRISDLYALMDNLASVDYLKINKFYVKPWIIPLSGGLGFAPTTYNPLEVPESVTYIITLKASSYDLVSKDGRFTGNYSMTGTHTITDAAHKAKFTLRLVSTTNTFGLSSNYVNRKYQITVSHINSDYTDTGYTIPIFSTNTDLTANITETV